MAFSHLGRPPHQQYRSGPTRKPPYPGAEQVSKASVLRTRNFKRLAEASGGADTLGSLLGLTVERLKALEEGREFSDEMAFYLETELQLKAGWFDELDPVVPSAVSRRAEVESDRAEPQQQQAVSVAPQSAPLNTQAAAAPAPLEQRSAPVLASNAASDTKETAMPSPDNKDPVFDIRSENFALLTRPKGAKAGMARAMGCTPANVSHILRGKKISREQAASIERSLGLPSGWFETRQSDESVPSAAFEALTGKTAEELAKMAATEQPRSAPRKPLGRPPGSSASASPARVTASPQAVTEMARAEASQPRALAPEVALPSGPVMSEKTRELLVRTEGQMGIIAEALVKTLIEKSRAGQLSEEFAYRMLSQVMET